MAMLLISMNGISSSSLSLTKIFTYSIWQQKSLLQNVISTVLILYKQILKLTIYILVHILTMKLNKEQKCICIPHRILDSTILDVIDIGFSLAFIPSLLAAFDIGNNFRVSSAAASCSILPEFQIDSLHPTFRWVDGLDDNRIWSK